jgi:hypothetical protein
MYYVSNRAFTISLMRRTVQSYVEIRLFPLDESGSLAALNNRFRKYRLRDKSPQERDEQ